MKSFTVATILFGAILLYLSASVSAGSITWGTKGPYDRQLARDVIQKKSAWFSKQKVTVVFPPKGQQSVSRISSIQVTDLGGVDNYSTAELVEGGPGFSTATIIVKSQKRKPINMLIEYFGQ